MVETVFRSRNRDLEGTPICWFSLFARKIVMNHNHTGEGDSMKREWVVCLVGAWMLAAVASFSVPKVVLVLFVVALAGSEGPIAATFAGILVILVVTGMLTINPVIL